MPKWIKTAILILVILSFLPLSIVYVTRAQRSKDTRLSIIPDMDDQERYKAQGINTMFADHRAMRPQVEGTVARGQLQEDEHFYTGIVDGKPVDVFPLLIPDDNGGTPLELNDEFMVRGQERFNIYCSMCHGYGGYGDGLMARHMDAMVTDLNAADFKNTWVPPSNLHDPVVRERSVGHLYNSITNGIRNMPPYGPQIDPLDRWAIVAYVKALQQSQAASIDDVPPDIRPSIEMRRRAIEEEPQQDAETKTDEIVSPAGGDSAAESTDNLSSGDN